MASIGLVQLYTLIPQIKEHGSLIILANFSTLCRITRSCEHTTSWHLIHFVNHEKTEQNVINNLEIVGDFLSMCIYWTLCFYWYPRLSQHCLLIRSCVCFREIRIELYYYIHSSVLYLSFLFGATPNPVGPIFA